MALSASAARCGRMPGWLELDGVAEDWSAQVFREDAPSGVAGARTALSVFPGRFTLHCTQAWPRLDSVASVRRGENAAQGACTQLVGACARRWWTVMIVVQRR